MQPEDTLPPSPEETPAAPRRILFAITKANWGGAQRYVFDLALALKARGDDVAVAYGTEGLLVSKLSEAGIRTLALPHVTRDIKALEEDASPKTLFASVKQEWLALMALTRLVREERPDVLHVNSSKIGGLGALAGRLAGVKRIIFTAHGWAFNEERPWWQRMVLRVPYALTLWLSHRTICVSEAVRNDMSLLPFSKLSVIRHGIETPDFLSKKEAREKLLPTKANAYWIGMLAELHPTKRIEDAIDAFAERSGIRPDSILVIIGEGELREELEARIRHYGLEERIILLGFVDTAARYLKAFDLFLMVSRSEALGLALLEAGHAGLPVIVSRVGGMREIVRHKETGLLVPAQNPHALSRAMRTLIEHPDEAERYGATLQKRVSDTFSKEKMLTETFALYES